MSIIKAIEIKIVKAGTEHLVHHQAAITLEFAPQFVGDIIKSICGCELDDDDHNDLNDLHVYGVMASRFGKDWEFYVTAKVTYPDDINLDSNVDSDMFARKYKNTL